MPADIEQIRRHLQSFEFSRLLIEELGWNRYSARAVSQQIDGADYTLEPAAEKAGFVAFVCKADTTGEIPPYPIRRRIERQAAKTAFEHLIIFEDGPRTRQLWQWVKREAGKPAACREYEFRKRGNSLALAQRLQRLAFELEEEGALNISLVELRARQALDSERVTRQFYDRFKNELESFRSFIKGIVEQGSQDWYASLMLNRMMFVYFIQKQGFLDGDLDYLQNRLKRLQQQNSQGKFQQFYRLFLLRLFHEGLGQPQAKRAPELAQLLGKVPFLNGGLFEVHDLERDNPDIQIPDEAFQKIFDFFDRYRWHLDERPHRAEDEINPDVLGYIFEKYINQKQMGAYYTKEDITGYISRNTVLPFLFDAARKACPVAFAHQGGVWRLLQDDPDRYIYPAVSHGIARNARQPSPEILELPYELPERIAAGIHDVSQRGDWNYSAPEEYGLPTETWREVIARRQRYDEVRARLASGGVNDINDLITLNLDICRFAEDVIVQSEGPELLRAFWHSLRKVSVLDPACGSGAFLFAVLNILEPLYFACLDGMQGFLDDLKSSGRPHHPDTMRDFQEALDQVARHPSARYYVLKSIVLNNLYGVDIMEEAVEICKLRLFLKLVAQLESYDQIEPLPDIDFNIRTGNTLVGFTSLDAVQKAMTITPAGQYLALDQQQRKTLNRVNEDAEIAAATFQRFREHQTSLGGEITAVDKTDLRHRLDKLRGELDRYLAADYGVDPKDAAAYEQWRGSHQPFHWFVEFYGIINRGGFDVIIGNPPYVEYRNVRSQYTVKGYTTEACGDLYAFIMERSGDLLAHAGCMAMIVPVSITSTDGFDSLRQFLLKAGRTCWCIGFASLPCWLFAGVEKRLTIWLSKPQSTSEPLILSNYRRWVSEERNVLFSTVSFVGRGELPNIVGSSIAKVAQPEGLSVLHKLAEQARLGQFYLKRSPHVIYYTRKVGYFVQFLDFIPEMVDGHGTPRAPSELKLLYLSTPQERDVVLAILNSGLFFWFLCTYSDVRNLNRREVEAFPFSMSKMNEQVGNELQHLSRALMVDFKKHSNILQYGQLTIQALNPRPSKPIIDEIDRVLAKHYGFADEELDFIINYDIKYRLGRDGGQEDGHE